MNLVGRVALGGLVALAISACQARPDARANPQKEAVKAAASSPATGDTTPPTESALPSAASAPATPIPSASALSGPSCAAPEAAAPAAVLRNAPGPVLPLSTRVGLWLADEQYAILSGSPQATWADGAPTYAGQNTVLRSVAVARLPKALRAWLGRPVRVLGAAGVMCETRLQRFAVRAQVTPDRASAEVWDGCAEPPVASAVIAQRIWDLSARSGRQLVAEFSAPCRGALLAVDPDLPAPLVAAPEPASAELGERALLEFRKLPAYARIQASFKAEHPNAEGQWDDHEAHRSVWTMRLAGHVPLLFLSVEVGPGCAQTPFSASLSALWAENAAPAGLSLLAVPEALDDRRLTPRALLDLEADGNTELLLGPDGRFAARALLVPPKARATSWTKVLLGSVPFFVGPC